MLVRGLQIGHGAALRPQRSQPAAFATAQRGESGSVSIGVSTSPQGVHQPASLLSASSTTGDASSNSTSIYASAQADLQTDLQFRRFFPRPESVTQGDHGDCSTAAVRCGDVGHVLQVRTDIACVLLCALELSASLAVLFGSPDWQSYLAVLFGSPY